MIEAEQLKYKLNSFQEPLEDLSGSLALEAKKERIDQLELNMEEPGFWDNVEESQNVMKEVKSLKGVVEEYDDLKTKYEDIETLIDMAEEDEDADLIEEATALMDEFEKTYEELRISTLLTGEYDKDDAILTLHAGAGFEMFNDMTKAIQEETTGALFHVQVEQKIEREEAPKITGTNKDAEVEKKPYVRKGAKVGRNDPCPCGSGKKYKNCCGRNK